MGTHVLYNGIHLYNVQTRQWDEEMVYDDSHTDLVRHLYHLRFETVVHDTVVSSSDPIGVTEALGSDDTVANRYARLRALLAQPRSTLQISMDDPAGNPIQILKAEPAGRGSYSIHYDVDNGPKPHDVSVIHIAGLKCWRVVFAIDVAKVECAANGMIPFILNNRWSIAEEMDADGFTTRNITGHLRLAVAEALIAQMQNVAPWRSLCVPSLEYGFRRDRMEFAVSANGLDCDYRVTDRQIHTAAPWPATKMDLTHVEETGNGLTFTSECGVRLEGPPHVPKALLLARAVQCVDARLNFLEAVGDKRVNYIIESGRVVNHIGERNAVEVALRLARTPNDIPSFVANLSKKIAEPLKLPGFQGQPEQYSPQKSTPLHPYGYTPAGETRVAVVALLACYLQSPCSPEHSIQQPQGPATQLVETPPAKTGHKPGTGYTLPSGKDKLSASTKQYMYSYCTMHSEYLNNDCRVALPKAWSPPEESENTSDSADPPDTVMVFRLGSGICYRKIVFDAERVGAWPQIPEPVDVFQEAGSNLRGTRLRAHIIPHASTLSSAKDQLIYRVRGEYVYVLNRPPTKKDALSAGVLPFVDAASVDGHYYPAQSFDASLGPAVPATSSKNR